MAWETNETTKDSLNITLNKEGKVDGNAVRTIQGITDQPLKEGEESFNLVLPPLGSVHPHLGLAYTLKSKQITQKSAVFYEATLNYSTPEGGSDDPSNPQYPWNEPAVISFSTLNETGETEIDADGDAIETVNGESFSVTKDYADQGVQVTKNFLSYAPASFYNYINTIRIASSKIRSFNP